MAYQTGTATGGVDLLDKLRLFCIAQSITVNEFLNDGSYQILSIEFGSGFFSLGFQTLGGEFIAVTQSTAWNPATAFGSQPNQTNINGSPTTNFVTGAVSEYHFFYFPNGMLYVSAQMAGGNWIHFGCGDITKYGTYTGGSLTLGNWFRSNQAGQPYSPFHSLFGMHSTITFGGRAHILRVDYPTTSPTFYSFNGNSPVSARGYMSIANDVVNSNQNGYFRATPSGTTQATATTPVYMFIEDQVVNNRIIPVGEIPDLRIINMNFFNPGDTFDSDWLVFPLGAKRDDSINDTDINTGFMGVALRFQ